MALIVMAGSGRLSFVRCHGVGRCWRNSAREDRKWSHVCCDICRSLASRRCCQRLIVQAQLAAAFQLLSRGLRSLEMSVCC